MLYYIWLLLVCVWQHDEFSFICVLQGCLQAHDFLLQACNKLFYS